MRTHGGMEDNLRCMISIAMSRCGHQLRSMI